MESSNSLNLFFRHPTGYVAQVTIRSENSGDLINRFGKMLAWLQETGCQPAERAEVVIQWPTTEPVVSDNGQAIGNRPDWCIIHKCEMPKHTKGNQVWYSHKIPDGQWCRGKNGK